jgi:transcriptional regulator with XRE-family HTH domain
VTVEPPAVTVIECKPVPALALTVDDIQTRVSSNMRLHRKRLKLTQLALGERLDFQRSYVWKIEAGRCLPRLHTLEAIAAALGVHLLDLIDDPFIQELLPYIPKINAEDRQKLLGAYETGT